MIVRETLEQSSSTCVFLEVIINIDIIIRFFVVLRSNPKKYTVFYFLYVAQVRKSCATARNARKPVIDFVDISMAKRGGVCQSVPTGLREKRVSADREKPVSADGKMK